MARSHGSSTGQRNGATTFSPRRWAAMQAAQQRFWAEAFARGATDARLGRPMERNAGAAYRSGHASVTQAA